MMRDSRRRRGSNIGSALMAGMVLLALGTWFFLNGAGYELPHLGQLWPLFMILGGAASLGSFVWSGLRNPEHVFAGVAAILLGVFFLLFTLGTLEWRLMSVFWPVFPLVGGTALLARWAAGLGRRPQDLASGLTAIVVGIGALAFTATPLRNLFGWPVILVFAGIILIGRALLAGALSAFGWAGRRVP